MATMMDLFSGGVDKVTSGSALVSGFTAVAQPAIFYGCDGRNTNSANVVYLWVCDCTSVGAITASNVIHVVGVPPNTVGNPATGNFGVQEATFGEFFTQGITIAGSTTDFPNFTILPTAQLFISCDFALEYGE